MSLASQPSAQVVAALLAADACADTAAATGGWVSIAGYDDDVVVISNVGVVTAGSIAGKIQDADDGSGTNAADVSGATFTTVTTSNDPLCEKIVLHASGLRPYIRYVGTITTGPVDVGVVVAGHQKYA